MTTDPVFPHIDHIPQGAVDIPGDVRRGIVLDDDRLRRELIAMTDRRFSYFRGFQCRKRPGGKGRGEILHIFDGEG